MKVVMAVWAENNACQQQNDPKIKVRLNLKIIALNKKISLRNHVKSGHFPRSECRSLVFPPLLNFFSHVSEF